MSEALLQQNSLEGLMNVEVIRLADCLGTTALIADNRDMRTVPEYSPYMHGTNSLTFGDSEGFLSRDEKDSVRITAALGPDPEEDDDDYVMEEVGRIRPITTPVLGVDGEGSLRGKGRSAAAELSFDHNDGQDWTLFAPNPFLRPDPEHDEEDWQEAALTPIIPAMQGAEGGSGDAAGSNDPAVGTGPSGSGTTTPKKNDNK